MIHYYLSSFKHFDQEVKKEEPIWDFCFQSKQRPWDPLLTLEFPVPETSKIAAKCRKRNGHDVDVAVEKYVAF